ncbi:hypothetical protein [Phenylobacterium aquaticum]|uniref:hypothetical protein n=1 Tax=Phenylobacterium aquaticum TaxID=1763816 RepID=UPI0026F1220A|nr:hypothetical protein [Phenylobacterium aquaticum]
MAKSKRDGSPLMAIAAIILVAGAAGGFLWLNHGKTTPAPVPTVSTPPALPTGKLQLIRDRLTEARYLGLDRKATPQGIEIQILTLGKAADGLEGGIAMTSQTKILDCARGRIFDGNLGSFDAYGRLTATKVLYAGTLGRASDTDEVEMTLVCGPAPAAKGKPVIVTGYRAAQLESQLPPDDYGKVAEAHPQDPAAWAWLCAAGSRARWRAETPADCDRAAKLNPANPEVLLDRGFLNLKIGRPAVSEAQFRAVFAKFPDNAAAYYGLSLLQAMRSGQAASRAARVHALDLDEGVVDWVVERYGLQSISQEYRVR